MKISTLILAFFIVCSLAAQREIVIQESGCAQMRPKQILKGKTQIDSGCDTLFLLSKATVKFMEQAIKDGRVIDDVSNNLQDTLIQDLRFALDSYEKIHEAYQQLSGESQEFLQETNRSLDGVNDALAQANKFAEIANENIAAATELIQKEQRNRFWKDLGKIGGGIVVGGVIGILIAN